MHLPRRLRHPGLRAALREARETYRQYSGAAAAAPSVQPAPESVPVRREEPDVVLDVPTLHVDEIDLKLDELKARVALEAHVLDLLRLDVGVDAELRGVGLKIAGVDAEAHLRVRLDNLTVILDRVMSTIDRNPQLLERLADRLGTAVDGIAQGAGTAVGELGRGAGEVAHALAPDTTRANGAPPQ